jgi:hypothetical protein
MKKSYAFLSLLFALLIFKTAYAQNIQWQNTIGGSGSEGLYFYCIQLTIDGGY